MTTTSNKKKFKTRRARVTRTPEPKYGTPDEEMPQITPEQFTQAAALRHRRLNAPAKKRITINLDEDILKFFKAAGDGYQTRINEALLRYMMRVQAQSSQPTPKSLIYQLRHNLDELLQIADELE